MFPYCENTSTISSSVMPSLKITKAHGPCYSHEKHFPALTKLELSYDYTCRLVKSYMYLPLNRSVAVHLKKLKFSSLTDGFYAKFG